ncbi:hypothetical protein GPECTOR_34g683 [Gonium pectorale]|uniref:J domain-containing protein n=1 Tax=Gonium pectorale TaxID=33097 RepID=A0A150GCF5_GONPE|nr:hypothetical protein GPECTOR_34g683 [Gonium pectorale]|eukprot:KXZ47524.1 hypothetical protein GPECTOR_34g683 [Gonium pectorale]
MSVIEQTPHYTLTRQDDGLNERFLLVVQLPGVESASELDVVVRPNGICIRVPGRYKLDLLLDPPVEEKPELLRFVKKKSQLKAVLLVAAPSPALPQHAQPPPPLRFAGQSAGPSSARAAAAAAAAAFSGSAEPEDFLDMPPLVDRFGFAGGVSYFGQGGPAGPAPAPVPGPSAPVTAAAASRPAAAPVDNGVGAASASSVSSRPPLSRPPVHDSFYEGALAGFGAKARAGGKGGQSKQPAASPATATGTGAGASTPVSTAANGMRAESRGTETGGASTTGEQKAQKAPAPPPQQQQPQPKKASSEDPAKPSSSSVRQTAPQQRPEPGPTPPGPGPTGANSGLAGDGAGAPSSAADKDLLYVAAKALANREAAQQWLERALAAARQGDRERTRLLLERAVGLCPEDGDRLMADFNQRCDPEHRIERPDRPPQQQGQQAAAGSPKTGNGSGSAPAASGASQANGSGGGSGPSKPAPGQQQAGSSSGANGAGGGGGRGSGGASSSDRSSQPYGSSKPEREHVRPQGGRGAGSKAATGGGPGRGGSKGPAAAGGGAGGAGAADGQRQAAGGQQSGAAGAAHKPGPHAHPQQAQPPQGPGQGRSPPNGAAGPGPSVKPEPRARAPPRHRGGAGSDGGAAEDGSAGADGSGERRWDWWFTGTMRAVRKGLGVNDEGEWQSDTPLPTWRRWLGNVALITVFGCLFVPHLVASLLAAMLTWVYMALGYPEEAAGLQSYCLRYARWMFGCAAATGLPLLFLLYLCWGAATAVAHGLFVFVFGPPWWLAGVQSAALYGVISSKQRPLLALLAPVPVLWGLAGTVGWRALSLALYVVAQYLAPGRTRAAFFSGAVVSSVRGLLWYQSLPAVLLEGIVWLMLSAAASSGDGGGGGSAGGGGGAGSSWGSGDVPRGGHLAPEQVKGATGEIARVLAARDHFAVLGLSASGPEGGSALTDEAVRSAYRRTQLRVHPDKAGPDAAGAEQASKRVNEAYRLLQTSDSRKKLLGEMEAANAPPPPPPASAGGGGDGGSSFGAGGFDIEMRCWGCAQLHTTRLVSTDSSRARYCSECKAYHPAADGDMWIWEDPEAFLFPTRKMLYCIRGMVLDITPMATCCNMFHERGRRLPGNTHNVQYRVATGSGGKPTAGASGGTYRGGSGGGRADKAAGGKRKGTKRK